MINSSGSGKHGCEGGGGGDNEGGEMQNYQKWETDW